MWRKLTNHNCPRNDIDDRISLEKKLKYEIQKNLQKVLELIGKSSKVS